MNFNVQYFFFTLIKGSKKMSLENTSTQELIDLDNLLCKDNNTYEDWLDAYNEEEIRNELIDSITSTLKSSKYDGPNDYHAMYWFAKGKRNADSDNELFNNIHKYKVHDKVHEFKRQRLHDKFKNDRLKEDRELHKKDSSFLRELMEHQRDLTAFNQYYKKHKLDNKMKFKSYEEFKAFERNKDGQKEIINEIIEEITKTPTNWSIDFRKLNNYGKNQLRPELLSLLMDEVAPRINANQHEYIIKYLVNDEWHSKPLNDETFTQLIKGLNNENIFDCVMTENSDGTPIFSDAKTDIDFIWYYFEVLEFTQIQKKKKEYKKNKNGDNRPDTNEARNGAFFPYWNNSDLDLSRYQILHKNDNFLMNKEHEKIPCIIFALCQLIPKELHGSILCRFIQNEQREGRQIEWISNEYNNKHLDFICKEYSIYCKIHYYDEYAVNQRIRTIDRGITKDKAKYKIELGMYKEHYFVYEKTKYTRYFIQHYEELKDVKESYKIIGKNKYNKYQRDSRIKYCLNSLELLIEMMKQGLFTQMNFRDIYILRSPLLTIHGKKVNDDTPLNEIANVNFDYGGQMFYDFEAKPVINSEEKKYYDENEYY